MTTAAPTEPPRSAAPPSVDHPSTARAVLAVSAVSLRRLLRDKVALFFILLMPVVVMVIIGSTFGAAPRSIPVGVVDLDGTAVSKAFVQGLRDAGTVAATDYPSTAEAEADVRTDRIVATVRRSRARG